MIGIAGGSCSGKTTLAARLAERLPRRPVTIISLDSYYRDLSHLTPEARAAWNFDAPDALDRDLLVEHLRALRDGASIEIPVYDFSTHTRASRTHRVIPSPFIIIEGLFVLYWDDIRAFLQTKVFIAAPHEVCLARRITRDVRERGRTEQSVRAQYAATVRPMYDQYCEPTARFADPHVSGEEPVDDSVSTVLNSLQRGEAY
jgi:uridine kinase